MFFLIVKKLQGIQFSTATSMDFQGLQQSYNHLKLQLLQVFS